MPHPASRRDQEKMRILQLCPSVGVGIKYTNACHRTCAVRKLGNPVVLHLTLNSRGGNHVNRSTHHLLEPVVKRYRTLGRMASSVVVLSDSFVRSRFSVGTFGVFPASVRHSRYPTPHPLTLGSLVFGWPFAVLCLRRVDV